MKRPETGVLIMTKAPRPGQVKTRLEPLLGCEGCAQLQRELIRHTVGWAADVADRAWVAYTPSDAAAEIAELVPSGMALFAQTDGDLGRRLLHAVGTIADEFSGPLVVIGTDAPLLGASQTRDAFATLVEGYDACLIPALDGGYCLVGLARPIGLPFHLPPEAWGGPRVLELTLGLLS
ncbi:MAG TPA: TIGR04282 family arsenosugar biosynthesis glycosyltransferase, partial [Pseudonocardiaceae bacterium]|nr:TIGR04282 family arsenosugar biosynthesis glycosyltransferase [Pseudonocardiaceae bacterium]